MAFFYRLKSVPGNFHNQHWWRYGSVYFVPALTGLSAPYWDSFARGMIIDIKGLSGDDAPGFGRGDHLDQSQIDCIFKPQMPATERERLYAEWTKAVKRCMNWAQ